MPSPHKTRGASIHYLAHNDVAMVTNLDDISIRSTEEMEKFESLYQREFGHTRVYDGSCSRGLEWTKSLPSSSILLVGENSMEGIGRLEQWMDDFATAQDKVKNSTKAL
jgi:hypothetical protein